MIRCTLQAKQVLIENISIYTPAGTKGLGEQKGGLKRQRKREEGKQRESALWKVENEKELLKERD